MRKLEEVDIIRDVLGNETILWCSKVVITSKKDGKAIGANLDTAALGENSQETGMIVVLLGLKIQEFGTAQGARDKFLTFAFNVVPFRASSVSYKETSYCVMAVQVFGTS